MTSIRIPGWLTDGTIKVPADTVQAMADLASAVRDQAARIAELEQRDAAFVALIEAIIEAITKHGFASEQANDAYREGLRVMNASGS